MSEGRLEGWLRTEVRPGDFQREGACNFAPISCVQSLVITHDLLRPAARFVFVPGGGALLFFDDDLEVFINDNTLLLFW